MELTDLEALLSELNVHQTIGGIIDDIRRLPPNGARVHKIQNVGNIILSYWSDFEEGKYEKTLSFRSYQQQHPDQYRRVMGLILESVNTFNIKI